MPVKKSKKIPYSKLKEHFEIKSGKNDDSFAHLTHYLQGFERVFNSRFDLAPADYKDKIINIFSEIKDNSNNYVLPIEWDVPFPPVKNPKFSFIDLFAGIGGIRLAYQRLGGKCVFSSEWDEQAKKTYEFNFGEVPFGDITKIKVNEIPDHDVLLAGFPCQPFSIAGVSKKNALGRDHGFKDKTQGTLFFDIARIIEAKRPKAFMLENVKNLKSHDKGNTFKIITETLNELNYEIAYDVLDSKYFVPQHRERIVIIGFDRNYYDRSIDFKSIVDKTAKYAVKDILESKVEEKYTLTENLWNYLQEYARKHKEKGNGFGFGLTNPEGITRTLSARYYKDGSEILIPQKGKNPRRLTPTECARLQGFPDDFHFPVSDMQAYKQLGNSVTVPLIQRVGRRVINHLLNNKCKSDSLFILNKSYEVV